ncbi:Uncharacterised protein [Comamonas terrigena]|nr:Uncharacterised protein [Comamonas terrigena]
MQQQPDSAQGSCAFYNACLFRSSTLVVVDPGSKGQRLRAAR